MQDYDYVKCEYQSTLLKNKALYETYWQFIQLKETRYVTVLIVTIPVLSMAASVWPALNIVSGWAIYYA